MARILHLISQLEQGGAQRQLSYVVSRNETHELEIASLIASPKEKLFRFFQDPNVPVHFLSDSMDFYAPEILPTLRNLVSKRRYSLIFCWLFQSIVQGLIVARISGIPCIASPRSMMVHLKEDSFRLWEKILIHRSMLNADLTLFPSYSVAADFVDAGWTNPERARVVQNGVDADYFEPSTTRGPTVVTIGRDSPEKGLDDFERIAQQLKTEFPAVRFIVAGGTKRNGNVVEYAGHLDDVRCFLGQAMLFVNTSRFEGMNNSILEAQSMGIPVVARQLGSSSEIVEDGVTGILASSVEDLWLACRKLLQDAELRKNMGKMARERIVSRFHNASQVKKIEALYSELL